MISVGSLENESTPVTTTGFLVGVVIRVGVGVNEWSRTKS